MGFARRIKKLDQIVHQYAAHQRMIDQTQQHSIRPGRQTPQRRLNGTELPLFPIVIDDHFIRLQMNRLRDSPRIRAQHDSPHTDFRVRRDLQKMFEERVALVGKQRF